MNARLLLVRLHNDLPHYGFAFTNEVQFHEGLATVLTNLGVSFQREFVAGERDRFDFLCEGGLVIEAKIKGSFSEALRQVDRYCQRDDVHAVLIVATKLWAATSVRFKKEGMLHGKPVRIAFVGAQPF